MFSLRLSFNLSAGYPAIELKRPATGDELDDQHDDRREEDQVNEVPDGIDVDESQQSQNQQHNKDSPEHMFSFELVYFASHPAARVRLKDFQLAAVSAPGRRLYGILKKLLAARIRKD
jgi:hypothetical protein